jgi:hypothetical protein
MSPPMGLDHFAVFDGNRRLGATAVTEPECLLVPLGYAMTGQIQ